MTEYGLFLNHLRETHKKGFESKNIKHNYKAPNLDLSNKYCEACERECISHKSYQIHLQQTHYILPRFNYANSMDCTYNCRICSKTFKTTQGFTIHLKRTHRIDQPSADNSNNYCHICKITYLTHALFRKHLEYQHTTHRRDTNLKRPPEITTPYNYCRLCEKQYKKNSRYIKHLRNRHNRNLIQSPDKLPNLPDLGYLCLFCHLKFDSRDVFQDHCKIIHKVDNDGVITLDQELLDPGDLDFYCTACDQTFEQKPDYQTHLADIHNVKYAMPSNPHNENIPNNDGPTTESTAIENTKSTATQDTGELDIHSHDYCGVCKTTFLSNWNYRFHLHLVHYIDIEKRISTNALIAPDTLPDPDNPSFYCRVCKKTKKSAKRYRKHCRKAHLMKLKHKKKSKSIEAV